MKLLNGWIDLPANAPEGLDKSTYLRNVHVLQIDAQAQVGCKWSKTGIFGNFIRII